MIIEEKDSQVLSAQLRGPLYIWIGFVCISAYFTWQAYDLTGSHFHIEFPTFDSSVPMMLPLSICSVLNLILSWIIPAYILNRSSGLSTKFIAFVLRMGLIGSVVIYGLMCAVGGHDGNIILPFTIFALLGFIRAFPSRETFSF